MPQAFIPRNHASILGFWRYQKEYLINRGDLNVLINKPVIINTPAIIFSEPICSLKIKNEPSKPNIGFLIKKTKGKAHSKNLNPDNVKGSKELKPILITEKFTPKIAVIKSAKPKSFVLISFQPPKQFYPI